MAKNPGSVLPPRTQASWTELVTAWSMVQVGAASADEEACCATAGPATHGTRAAIHKTAAYVTLIKSSLSPVIVIAVAIVLSRLADDCSNAGACCTGD
jgi:hypothetical protein